MTVQKITILGSTGSIGDSTLDVISRNLERFSVFALTANSNWQKLFQQIKTYDPVYAVCVDKQAAGLLADAVNQLQLKTEVLQGASALENVASSEEVDTVMASIVGAAGLLPTLAAVRAGKRIMLANKESLVMAGELFMDEVQKNQALLLPVDSEHNALFQCLPNQHYEAGRYINWHQQGVEKLILTASGGPFLNEPLESLHKKTPQQACTHPNWEMGKKISVDSATLMNKGLEVIEASYLYGIKSEHIDVVIHPQSIVHSMVSYRDGSVLAELGNPDMRTPIAHALAWPERLNAGVEPLDLIKQGRLDFMAPDLSRFGCLELAYKALQKGGTAATVLNAANEVAVASFLKGKISFTDIADTIEQSVNSMKIESITNLETILMADSNTRKFTQSIIDAGMTK